LFVFELDEGLVVVVVVGEYVLLELVGVEEVFLLLFDFGLGRVLVHDPDDVLVVVVLEELLAFRTV